MRMGRLLLAGALALVGCHEEVLLVEASQPSSDVIVEKGCHAAGGTPSTSHCESPVSEEVLGATVPWTGLACEDVTYSCNRCPGGDVHLVGTWRHIHGGTEDPETPLDDGYRERLVFDGNTWSQHSDGFDIVLGENLTVDVEGWYFCGDKPEIDNKATVFMATSVSYEGGFGWEAGLVFSAEPLKDGADKLLFRWREGLNAGPYTDDIYCRIGSEIETLAGETKACTDPF